MRYAYWSCVYDIVQMNEWKNVLFVWPYVLLIHERFDKWLRCESGRLEPNHHLNQTEVKNPRYSSFVW